jgi:hypothetical protein
MPSKDPCILNFILEACGASCVSRCASDAGGWLFDPQNLTRIGRYKNATLLMANSTFLVNVLLINVLELIDSQQSCTDSMLGLASSYGLDIFRV